MRLKFTKTTFLNLAHPDAGKRLTVYDTEIPKLALRVTHAGTKTYYIVKRTGASMSWLKLGTFPEMTVEQARTEAQKVLGEFAAGANPGEARRAIRREPTFFEVFEQLLLEKRKRDGSHLAESTRRGYREVLNLYLNPIKAKKLSEITRTDVKSIHTKTTKHSPAQADRALAIISSVFSFAADLEIFEGLSPARRIQKNPAPSRDRFAQAGELPQLFAAIIESPLCDYFLLSLLTGARRSNVQAMAWRDLDLVNGLWRIGMTKNGTPQNVPLSPEAIEVLKTRKERAGNSPFIFPGSGTTGHLVEPKKAWATILRKASTRRLLDHLEEKGLLSEEERQNADQLVLNAPAQALRNYQRLANDVKLDPAHYDLTDLHIHDLRRTLGSWQAKTGASLPIIGKTLNHKTHQATLIYARLDLDPVRESVNTATQAMLGAAGAKKSARNVEPEAPDSDAV